MPGENGPLVKCVHCEEPTRGYKYTTAGWVCRTDWSKQIASYRVVVLEGVNGSAGITYSVIEKAGGGPIESRPGVRRVG